MKRLARFLPLLLSVLSGVAAAEADGPDYYAVHGVAADDMLNLRAGPDPRARKIGEIPPDAACLKNLGCRGGLGFREYTAMSPAQRQAAARQHPRWCQVVFQGRSGWVSGRYLRESSAACGAASRPAGQPEGHSPEPAGPGG